MNSTLKRFFNMAIFLPVFLVLIGCSYNSESADKAEDFEPPVRSAWIVYWDLEAGAKDLGKIEGKLDKLSYFAAYFDQNDHIFVPKELSDKKSSIYKRRGSYLTYLTFVNDKINADGSVAIKDTEILRRLLSTDAAMDKHIDDIIALTLQGGYDGIEIDYERVWKDEKLVQLFLKFSNNLYKKALKNNLQLRIVLEPGAPFSAPGFASGPEYVVMFYNLYGLHSAPGPKANREFIQNTLANMKALPGAKSAAFSTGGCVWGSNGEKRLVTEVEARMLAAVYNRPLIRDEKSQCVIFEYNARDISYKVWYADAVTLNYWSSLAKERGKNNISIWRLGDNVDVEKLF